MKKNVGNVDKIIRLSVAAALVVLYFTGVISGAVAIIGLVVAAIFTVTSMAGSCPIYSIVGASTCPVKKQD